MIVFGHIFVEIHYVSPFTLHNGALSLPPLGHGCEEEGICSLATACLFEALGSYNSVFNQALPRSIATAPILWTITHDANTTEEIVQFIEASLPGVRFLSHVQTSGTFLSPEDGEMARLAFDLCIGLAAILRPFAHADVFTPNHATLTISLPRQGERNFASFLFLIILLRERK